MSLLFYLFRIFPIKQNKIVFCNFNGNGFGESPKYIAQELINQGMKYDLVWIVRKELMNYCQLPLDIRPAIKGSIKSFFELATAKIWIYSSRQPNYIKKRKNQYYIQTWHGAPALKKIEKDAEASLDPIYIYNAKKDSQKIDLFLSNSKYFTNLVKRSFWYNGDILECGFPKNDALLTADRHLRSKVNKKFDIKSNARIVLYAPTFRSNKNMENYNIDIDKCLVSLSLRFGGDWIFMVRLHPNEQDHPFQILNNKKIINASLYDDTQELLSVADVVITDYSSLMFDFALTKRPVFLYTPDINEYMKERNFYFDLHDLPFPIAKCNDSLFNNIQKFEEQEYLLKIDSFLKNIGCLENGNASEIVVDRIIKIIEMT